jgi:subtilisin family serine protease
MGQLAPARQPVECAATPGAVASSRETAIPQGAEVTRTTAGRLGTCALVLLATLASASQGAAVRPAWKHLAPSSGTSPLMAFGGRSAAQLHSVVGGKLDAALADLVRHLDRVRPGHALADLHALSPAARFMQSADDAVALVAVDATARASPRQLEQALLGLGLRHPAVYSNDVGGWLPVSAIAAAAARTELLSVRAAMPRTRAAPIATQGDFTQGSAALRTTYPALSGAGITVGILSDSFNCYYVYEQPGSGVPASGTQGYAPFGFATDDAAFDEAQGYLPATVDVMEEADCTQYGQPLQLPFSDEGRAMLQIVHLVAPGAALAFYTAASSEADFASGITALAAHGATVIADDTGYFDEPFFQDGILAQAIDTVEASGVAYFSAAGNNGQLSYENTSPSFATPGSGATAGENLLNFDTTGKTTATSLPVALPALFPGEFLALIVQWDQPYVTGAPGSPGASSSINLCVTGAGAYSVFNLDGDQVTCTGPNATGVDSVQILVLGNPANAKGNTASGTVDLVIGLANGTAAPGRIKVVVWDDGAGSTIDSFATDSPTLQGHPGAAGALAVAAAFFAQTPRCGTSPAVLESFSAEGGEPILFNTSGVRLTTPEYRQKPDLTGPDGINTSFFGFPLSDSNFTDSSTVSGCQNDATFLNFFGTSAATPHAAAAAALLRQANPALTPSEVYEALEDTAAAMGSSTPNYESGYGFIDVEAAVAALPAGPPVLKLASSTIDVGSSTTLTWLAVNASSCTASGSWSGTQAASGSETLKPTAAGTYSYTLTCTSAAGSRSSSAKLTVQNATSTSSAPSSPAGGGGGALGGITLLALSGLVFASLVRRRRPRARAAAAPSRQLRRAVTRTADEPAVSSSTPRVH